MPSTSVVFDGPASPGLTLAPWRRGGGDPCYRVGADGAIWRTSVLTCGPVTARISKSSPNTVDCEVWGPGDAEFLDGFAALVGADDDAAGFDPVEPTIAEAYRRVPHLRLGRSGRVLEALVPAIIEQRVSGMDAWRAWRRLVTKYGAPAPGPAPAGMRAAPSADVWRRIPSWEFHRANVDPGRARTIVGCAQRAEALERLTAERAVTALRSLPGVGEWTAAETVQRAFGDADALSVGDYHLSTMVGRSLLGRPIDDDAMVELLEPLRPHRQRAVRLLEASGLAHNPRFGARQAIPNLRAI
ncbi:MULTISPECIES: DNA-3-methyladenine glycosylase [unclassified Mycolicibacterium]|uniref:DNA-3-methyladenine glycosylase family protein n=1 Tax=unclassified Mycolicibacterium TaxID=2636767 RepID=UPI00130AC2BB|nr:MULTISPECIES: DNA-3-methyladenine glycosylase 2 family protein [unclassified Mycolicibacterium]MUL83168.1 DNA-3-methyladenine glycosylase 2 family protein [Mycolicibacterium sp. CBMA 329]MUL89503.1 DNA-3-methyladenine glycosylase 2 family protein [Mycolicibacterium sp. CBMA 331]MUM02740.1 DNA-3-methyladenine glycosylase 2 family protein [Mycolicibacterium sp. CBMA 334]MUM29912.1 DNA-3-methyladenine glycosylase 2 family protein [Mycolicibacterium sp. CBMA 295]MUM39019.1 DNA-3-methyladenine g